MPFSRGFLGVSWILFAGSFLLGQEKAFTLRVQFFHTEPDPVTWSGSVTPERARIDRMEGWRVVARDRVTLNSFTLRVDELLSKGITLIGTSDPRGRIRVTTNQGDFEVSPLELELGVETRFLEGKASAGRLPDSIKLTDDFRDDDYPSIAVADASTAWAVWQSYSGQMDEIRISKYDEGWRTFTRVPGVSGDVWRPQVSLDDTGRPWVVWAQQVDGNWDIYARALDTQSQSWEGLIRLSSHPNSDFDHHLISDSRGGLWVVWQGFHGSSSDIFLRHLLGSEWSEEIAVTDHPANDWEPRIAVGGDGRAYIVWDTYRNGNYDVYLRSYSNGTLGQEVAVASTPRFEAHASVAVDDRNRVWVAWDETGANWGKDTGTTIDPNWREEVRGEERWTRSPGVRIYGSRNLNLVVLDQGERRIPVSSLQETVSSRGDLHDFPQLLVDPLSGRVAVVYHSRDRTRGPGSARNRAYWETAVSFYEGDRWTPPLAMPHSWGRSSMRPDAAFGPEGNLWLIWPTDGRLFVNTHQPVVGNVYAGRLPLPTLDAEPELVEVGEPVPAEHSPAHPSEPTDVQAIRSYRAFVHGEEKRIVRGDFHRHTELSWDGGGRTDGSVLDFYRYMIDAAAMDFGAVTDHNAGGDYEYWWWLSEKTCDLFHIPRFFTTFYGYERSARFPDGHRNVFHTRRGVPVVSFFTETGFDGPRPGVATGDLMENDTKLLYESLRETGGIAISHTTGSTNMGTDWRDNDPEVEPVVEIFQGARVSYEYVGAPRAPRGPEDEPPGGFQEAGFLWNAYRKGYRLGTITSSDHNSTHISYAMVYTGAPTREAIFEAIKKRHTYGATDNIILEYWMGDRFMGEEFTASEVPAIRIRVAGTGPIAGVEIIKDEKILYTASPDQQEVELIYLDQDARPGTSYYYVRVIQQDRQMAWSSPIWMNYQP